MSLTSGSITARPYIVTTPPEPGFLEKLDTDLKRHAFKPVKPEQSPRSIGWVHPRDVLDTDLTVDKVVFEDFLVLGLRVDKLMVNSRLLKAHFNIERLKFMKERSTKKLSRDERAALLERVKLTLMKQSSPSTSFYEMAWNMKTNHVYFSGTSQTLNQEFSDLFGETFHVRIIPLLPFIRATKMAERDNLKEELLAADPTRLAPGHDTRMAGVSEED